VSTRYSFLTTWLLDSPREPVWDVIYDQRAWPEWWPGLHRVDEIHPGDELGIGAHSRLVWRAPLGYGIAFEARALAIEPPALVEAELLAGLQGVGRWRLFERDGITAVLYEMEVATARRWMNAVAPLARPLFVRNHDAVMRGGGEGLAGRLGVRLLASG
jgi:uncharacterized protein YndB with AHSA1/START domain